jgi:hypothetical protein
MDGSSRFQKPQWNKRIQAIFAFPEAWENTLPLFDYNFNFSGYPGKSFAGIINPYDAAAEVSTAIGSIRHILLNNL